jgi:hypothetical protein
MVCYLYNTLMASGCAFVLA